MLTIKRAAKHLPPGVITWAIIILAMAANIWVTVFTGLVIYSAFAPVEFGFYGIVFFGMALTVWCVSLKALPRTKVNDAITKVRMFKSWHGLGHMTFVLLMCWPRVVEAVYKGYKYREVRAIAIRLSESKMFSISLNLDNYEQHNGLGVSPEDLKDYMVLHDNEYLFKNDEALSYMLVKYSTVTILKSFGFFDGLDNNKTTFLGIFGPRECPLMAKAANELGETYDMQTPQSVSARIFFI